MEATPSVAAGAGAVNLCLILAQFLMILMTNNTTTRLSRSFLLFQVSRLDLGFIVIQDPGQLFSCQHQPWEHLQHDQTSCVWYSHQISLQSYYYRERCERSVSKHYWGTLQRPLYKCQLTISNTLRDAMQMSSWHCVLGDWVTDKKDTISASELVDWNELPYTPIDSHDNT